MTTGSIFLLVVFAASGGVFVFVGLLMERFSEKDWHKNLSDFRRCKSINVWGEWIVMLGIVVEIGVGIFSAIDAWQTRKMAIENDPLNQPISDVSALVTIKVKGTNFIESPLWGAPPVAYLMMCKSNIYEVVSIEFAQLEADNFNRVQYFMPGISGGENAHGYILNFHKDALMANYPSHGKIPKTIEIVSNINFLKIEAKFIPNDAEVIGGYAEVIVNGSIRKRFEIYPQKALSVREDGLSAKPNDSGFSLIATNSTP